MIVQTYSSKYQEDVAFLVNSFHEEALGDYSGNFDKDRLIRTISSLDEKSLGHAYLLIINGKCEGILFGIMIESLSSRQAIFQEIIWYVSKPFRRYGVFLLKEVEKRLKAIGVDSIIMVVLENSKSEKIKSFYKRVGYRPMESHHIKDL